MTHVPRRNWTMAEIHQSRPAKTSFSKILTPPTSQNRMPSIVSTFSPVCPVIPTSSSSLLSCHSNITGVAVPLLAPPPSPQVEEEPRPMISSARAFEVLSIPFAEALPLPFLSLSFFGDCFRRTSRSTLSTRAMYSSFTSRLLATMSTRNLRNCV